MKKSILLFVLLAAFNFGQAASSGKNIIGLIVGANINQVSNYNSSAKAGGMLGFHWNWKFSERFYLISNFIGSQRSIGGKEGNSSFDLTYLNMPILLQYQPTEKIGVNLGVNADALLLNNYKSFDKDVFNGTDWGLPLGISLSVSPSIQLNATCVFGLSDLTKNDNLHIRNNWASLTATILFNGRKNEDEKN